MTAIDVARKRKNLSLEESLIEGVEKMVSKTIGINSFSAYVENLLAAHLIANNALPPGYRLPGETRGGDRTSTNTEENNA